MFRRRSPVTIASRLSRSEWVLVRLIMRKLCLSIARCHFRETVAREGRSIGGLAHWNGRSLLVSSVS
jgi:hypothetical protein